MKSNIVSSLDDEALDGQSNYVAKICKIDEELKNNGLQIFNNFTKAGARFCF